VVHLRCVRRPLRALLIAGLSLVAVHAPASPTTLVAQSPTAPTVEEQTPTGAEEASGPSPLWQDGTWKAGMSLGSPLAGWRPMLFAVRGG